MHRDLKLENVMMTDTTDNSTPKLVDFGLAKKENSTNPPPDPLSKGKEQN